MMHWKTKEGHVKRLKEAKPDITEKEIEEAIANIEKEGAISLATRQTPNAAISEKLSGYDYENMIGDKFRDYCLFVQSLQLDDSYDFEQYLVEVQKKPRYRGVKDSPVDIIGFKMVNSKPINTTRIPVKMALITNGRVSIPEGENFFETIGSQLEHNGKNGRFFLLKK